MEKQWRFPLRQGHEWLTETCCVKLLIIKSGHAAYIQICKWTRWTRFTKALTLQDILTSNSAWQQRQCIGLILNYEQAPVWPEAGSGYDKYVKLHYGPSVKVTTHTLTTGPQNLLGCVNVSLKYHINVGTSECLVMNCDKWGRKEQCTTTKRL